MNSILSYYTENRSEGNKVTFSIMDEQIKDNKKSYSNDIESQWKLSNEINSKACDTFEDHDDVGISISPPSFFKQKSKFENFPYININALHGMDMRTFAED